MDHRGIRLADDTPRRMRGVSWRLRFGLWLRELDTRTMTFKFEFNEQAQAVAIVGLVALAVVIVVGSLVFYHIRSDAAFTKEGYCETAALRRWVKCDVLRKQPE